MNIVHLAASPFFGGPERQMLGLALNLPAHYRSIFLSFPERGLCKPFLAELRRCGFSAIALKNNAPHFLAAVKEVAARLRQFDADVLCCHGYKADLLGWAAARRVGIPVVAVSRGWTGATWKVRLNETLDRWILRRMDQVVCVSEGQARKVLAAKVAAERVQVIRNAIRLERFEKPDPQYRQKLRDCFRLAPARVVCAAGRLSPEKGFEVLVEAAGRLDESIGFVLFGEGPLREKLEKQISDAGLRGRFVLAGFRKDVDLFLPHADLLVLPSYTEGLPNVALEALAAGVPVVATAVGGTPEVVEDQVCGYLVEPGDSGALARRIHDALESEERRRLMGQRGRARVSECFTFDAQSAQYQRLFEGLTGGQTAKEPAGVDHRSHGRKPMGERTTGLRPWLR